MFFSVVGEIFIHVPFSGVLDSKDESNFHMQGSKLCFVLDFPVGHSAIKRSTRGSYQLITSISTYWPDKPFYSRTI